MRPERPNKIDTLIIWGYAALHALTAFFHEPWEDEAQAWLIARDVPLQDFFRVLSFEGTPGLWHALLMPLARSGLPYWTETALNLGICVALAALVMRHAPFPRWIRVLILTSGIIGYELPTFARSYALGALLLFLAAHMYARRFEQPLTYALIIALLANANVFTLFAATALGAAYAFECIKRRNPEDLWALTAMFTGGLLALVQLFPRDGTTLDRASYLAPGNAALALTNSFFPGIGHIEPLIFVPAALTVLAAIFWTLRRKPLMITYLAAPMLACLAVFVWLHPPDTRRASHLLLFPIAALWIWIESRGGLSRADNDDNRVLRFLGAALAVSTLPVIFNLLPAEFMTRSSDARNVAEYIESEIPQSAVIAAYPDMPTGAALPYLPDRKFWRPYAGKFMTYTEWTRNFVDSNPFNTPPDRIAMMVQQKFRNERQPFLLLNNPLTDPAAFGYTLVYSTKDKIVGRGHIERYFLYAPLDK